MIVSRASILTLAIVGGLAAVETPAAAAPLRFDAGLKPESQTVQEVRYRRHARAYPRYYRRHSYNPGPAAVLGAMAGIVGAGIAASQPRYYYGPAYGYGYYPGYYGGYAYPYYGW